MSVVKNNKSYWNGKGYQNVFLFSFVVDLFIYFLFAGVVGQRVWRECGCGETQADSGDVPVGGA
jgi:hypothetical protein